MKYYIVIGFILLLGACKKDNRLMYEEDPRIYFTKYILWESNPDSTVYSFRFKSTTLMTDTVYMTMRIIGSAAKTDRVINVIPDASSTAIQGYHYQFGKLVMPADSFQVRLPVYVFRKPGLKDSIVNLNLSVGTSADFKPGFDDFVRNSKSDRLHFKISITDRLVKPGRWDGYWVNYFGAYSEAKFQFIILVTGKKEWEGVAYPQDIDYMITSVREALRVYKETNGHPMLDESGNEITLPIPQ